MISGANDWNAYCRQHRDWLEDLRELLAEVEDRLAPCSLRRSRVRRSTPSPWETGLIF